MNACAYVVIYAALVTGFCVYILLALYRARLEFKQLIERWDAKRESLSYKIKNELGGTSTSEIAEYISANFDLDK